MNLLDFVHSFATGEWRLQRDQVRDQRRFLEATRGKRDMMMTNQLARMRLYAGAEPGMKRPMANVLSTPEDYKQAYERIILIRAARQLEEDAGFFDGLLDDFETYAIGEYALYLPNTGNPEADKVIREYLEAQFDAADYTRRLDLTKIAQLAIRSMKRDGECGFVPIDVGDAIKLQYHSGDCIGNPMIGANVGPNNWNGIITTPDGAPALYQLFKRLPKMNAYVFDRNVPADHFWHYYDPFRFQQYHGVSAFKNAIADGFDLDQILEFTKLNMKFRASQLPSVHTETGRPRGAGIGYWGWGTTGGGVGGGPTNAQGVPQPMTVDVNGVSSTYLKLDESVMEYPNDFPNGQLQVSVEEFRRQCCKGAKIPYEFAYRADNGGVVQRFWVDKAMQTFGKDRHLARRVVLNPYKNRSIEKGIQTGELDLRKFGDLDVSTERFRGQWQLGRAVSVDYGRETDADIKQMEAGVMSPVDYAASMGRNLDEVRGEIKMNARAILRDAEELAEEFGITIQEAIPYVVKKFPNPVTTVGGGGSIADDKASEIAAVKSKADAIGVGVRAGIITPQESDESELRKQLGMAPISPAAKKAWDEDGGVRRPITLTNPDGGSPLSAPAALPKPTPGTK